MIKTTMIGFFLISTVIFLVEIVVFIVIPFISFPSNKLNCDNFSALYYNAKTYAIVVVVIVVDAILL